MGLRNWIRGLRKATPRRPWVRPEFLGLFALLVVSGGAFGLYAWSEAMDDSGSSGPPVAQREEYVGLTPSEAISCAPDCNVDGLYYVWGLDHPDARILEKTPRYYQGLLIGYNVVYEEPAN